MAHKIELTQLGFGGGISLVVAIAAAVYLGSQTKISRGVVNDTILAFAGETYSTHVQCDRSAKVEPSLLKSFVGLHAGEKVYIKGYNISDARAALREQFPDCQITALGRSSPALWKKLI